MCDTDAWEGEGGFVLTTDLEDGIIENDDASQEPSGVTNPTK